MSSLVSGGGRTGGGFTVNSYPLPTVVSSVIEDAEPTILTITFDKEMSVVSAADVVSQLEITVDVAEAVNPASVVADGVTVVVTLAGAAVNGEVITWSYIQGPGNISSRVYPNIEIQATDEAVTNNVAV